MVALGNMEKKKPGSSAIPKEKETADLTKAFRRG
jgi:hypothetical protein